MSVQIEVLIMGLLILVFLGFILKLLVNLKKDLDSSECDWLRDWDIEQTEKESESLSTANKIKTKSDLVLHPNHYTDNGIECIDYIKERLTWEEFRGYLKGNVIKYLHRERFKGGSQDIEKATVYLGWLNDLVSNKGK